MEEILKYTHKEPSSTPVHIHLSKTLPTKVRSSSLSKKRKSDAAYYIFYATSRTNRYSVKNMEKKILLDRKEGKLQADPQNGLPLHSLFFKCTDMFFRKGK